MSDKVISEIAKSIIMEEVISEDELYRIRDLSDGSILALVTFNPGKVNIPEMTVEVDQAEGDLETEAAYSPDADVLSTPDELSDWVRSMSSAEPIPTSTGQSMGGRLSLVVPKVSGGVVTLHDNEAGDDVTKTYNDMIFTIEEHPAGVDRSGLVVVAKKGNEAYLFSYGDNQWQSL